MCKELDSLLQNFNGNGVATDEMLKALEQQVGLKLPVDYRDFLAHYNGGEGFIAKQYLIIWRAEEILPFNTDYEVNLYAPGLLLFASNGGGEAFAFDTRSSKLPIVQVPFIGLELRYAKHVADGFSELLHKMSHSNGSLL